MTHAIERELLGPTPRNVEHRPGHPSVHVFAVVLGLPHTLVGLGLIAATLYMAAFDLFGGIETATVETVSPIIDKQLRRGRHGSTWVRYRFESLRSPIEATMVVRPDDFAAIETGAKVTVLFDPDRPRRNTLYAYGPWKVAGGR